MLQEIVLFTSKNELDLSRRILTPLLFFIENMACSLVIACPGSRCFNIIGAQSRTALCIEKDGCASVCEITSSHMVTRDHLERDDQNWQTNANFGRVCVASSPDDRVFLPVSRCPEIKSGKLHETVLN